MTVESASSPPDVIASALDAIVFGQSFTDHVARATYDVEQGWHEHRIVPLRDLSLHPGAAALHFGQAIFEGLKAYRHADDSIWLFRPDANAKRFAHSARRLAMPPLPEDDFVESLRALVTQDQVWVPRGDGEQSLYLRPLMFATEPMLAPHVSSSYNYLVMATPAGPYYPAPMRLWVTRNFSRAAPGGTGAAKCAGNYAAAFAAEKEAAEHGCGQVLWLDAATTSHVEECGTMNFFVVTAAGELITPTLTGSILPGVTRDSLLTIASRCGLRPSEQTVSIDELCERIGSGAVTEAFACGTAAVVNPIVGIDSSEWSLTIGDGTPGPTTRSLREYLTGIQYGDNKDEHDWMVRVC